MCCLFGDKPRERDFLKTLRLVSGTEACAVEQHGETLDDDKGVRVAAPPPKNANKSLFNQLIKSVLWQVNSSVETVPLYNYLSVVSHNRFSSYSSPSVTKCCFLFPRICLIMPRVLIRR